MAREPFLINPARRLGVRRRRRKSGLPSPLLSRMMRTHGPRTGMKKAWSAYRKGIRRNKNPFGEEVMIVGLNPRRRRRVRRRRRALSYAPVRRRRRRRAALDFAPVRRRRRRRVKARRRRRVAAYAPVRRRRRRRRAMAFYPVRRRRRRARARVRVRRRRARTGRSRSRSSGVTLYGPTGALLNNRGRRRRIRHNAPARLMGFSLPMDISLRRPMGILMPVAVGTASYYVTSKAPDWAGMTGEWTRLGVKAAVGVGGGMFLGRFVGRQNAALWMIVAGVNIANDLLQKYFFGAASAGIGAYAPYALSDDGGVGAFAPDYSLSEGNPYAHSYE